MSWKGCSDKLDVVIGWTGHVSHHLGLLLGAVLVNCFVCVRMRNRIFLIIGDFDHR